MVFVVNFVTKITEFTTVTAFNTVNVNIPIIAINFKFCVFSKPKLYFTAGTSKHIYRFLLLSLRESKKENNTKTQKPATNNKVVYVFTKQNNKIKTNIV